MAIGLIGHSQPPSTRIQLGSGPQAGHHHNGNAHHHDHAGISHEARQNHGGGSHPLVNGLNNSFGGCRRGGSAQQLKEGLAKWEQAKCPKAKRAAAQELGQSYKDCKAQGVKLNPMLELKVVLVLALSGADGPKEGGDRQDGGQQGPGKCGEKKKSPCRERQKEKKPKCPGKPHKPHSPQKPRCPKKSA